jgi:hypothetical protein
MVALHIKVNLHINISEIILYFEKLPLKRYYINKLFAEEQSHRNLLIRLHRKVLQRLEQSIQPNLDGKIILSRFPIFIFSI